jgi:hypothetical protein
MNEALRRAPFGVSAARNCREASLPIFRHIWLIVAKISPEIPAQNHQLPAKVAIKKIT